jgi:hypothetical protein
MYQTFDEIGNFIGKVWNLVAAWSGIALVIGSLLAFTSCREGSMHAPCAFSLLTTWEVWMERTAEFSTGKQRKSVHRVVATSPCSLD